MSDASILRILRAVVVAAVVVLVLDDLGMDGLRFNLLKE